MAISMTGCGEGLAGEGESTCRVELRVVNNRFFKLAVRSRDAFAPFEPRIEALLRARIRRGAVQMTLDVAGPSAPASRRFDRQQLAAYLDDLEDFCAAHRIPAPGRSTRSWPCQASSSILPPHPRRSSGPGPSSPARSKRPSTGWIGCDGPRGRHCAAT